ncbi:endonuclease/exonuclease/phosphatase family protein [Haloferula sp.]|uniref:endonuclease/exonuclease/phosphatase family protein n=1 Tax=Haloferula sp. TaxID=2497595 RepID=UPI00329FE2AC
MWRLLLILFCLTAPLEAVGLRVVSYNVGAEFENGSFIYGIGDSGQPDHDKVLEVLSRIDADVVALQEIHYNDVLGNPDDLDDLAASLGLPYVYSGSGSGAIDFQIRVVILSRFPFLRSEVIDSPSGAMEISRLLPAVKVDVPGTDSDPWIVSAHIKSGGGSVDRFRKAIEIQRLAGFFESEGITDEDPFVILGDFNPSGADKDFSMTDYMGYTFPLSYSLGGDVTFPVSYTKSLSPYFSTVAPVLQDPRQLDGSAATFDTGSVLDLLLVSPSIAGRPIASEIYNSVLDDSNETGLMKSGSPLDDTVSLEASDHYPLFADIELDDPDPYFLTQSGSSIVENFDGYDGLLDPDPWSSMGADWMGEDDGTSESAGGRSYGSGPERAPGFIVSGVEQSFEAEFLNQSDQELTILDVSYLAEQWRSSFGGSADRIEVDLLVGEMVTNLPALDFDARTDLATGPVAGGSPTSRSLRVRGLSIDQDESFRLRFRFVPGPGSGAMPADVFINEIHYDNEGGDVGEFVEVVVGPGYLGEVSDVSLTLYNGGDGEADASHSLSTFGLGTTTSSGHRVFSKMISSIQNGPSDGFALVVDGAVASFLSYEGTLVAVDGPAVGLSSVDVGVSQVSEPLNTNALGLQGTGGSAGDFAWNKISSAHSPGAPNDGQVLVLPGLPPQGLAIDDLVVTFVPDNDGDGLADDEDEDDDNDSQTDVFELAFGADPLDGASVFETTLGSGPGGKTLSFPGAVGITYTIEWCDDLISWDQSDTVEGLGAEIVYPLPSSGSRLFVRVRAGE